MRYVIVMFTWLLVFAAIFCFSISSAETPDAEMPNQADMEQEVVEEVAHEDSQGVDPSNDTGDAEEVQGDSQDVDPLNDIEGDEDPSDDSLPEESQRQEIFDDAFFVSLGYTNHGVDETIPEQFFRGHIVSLRATVFHRTGFRFAVENFTSVAGGLFSDLGDRTVLKAQFLRRFGSLYGIVQHRWVHTNYEMDQDFFFADRHRTLVQFGYSHEPLYEPRIRPYVFISSDLPAYTTINEMAVYGGGGLVVKTPRNQQNTELYFGFSAVRSLYTRNQSERALLRFRVGFVSPFGVDSLAINPEVFFLKGFDLNHLWVASFKIIF